MRNCVVCKIDKPLEEFHNDKNRPQGKDYKCKECSKKRRLKNKEYFKQKSKEYQEKNSSKLKKYYNQRYQENKEWYIKYHQQPEVVKKRRIYESKPEVKARNNEYKKQRSKENINIRVLEALRTRMYTKITQGREVGSIELLGESIEFVKGYIEAQFKPEMNWENYGDIWEIDHILPCSSFDLTDEEQQKKCFHYSNLQPLFKTTEIAEIFGYTDEIGNRNKHAKLI